MFRVTVLLPTYQSGRYLRECIESVMLQTLDDFELLVVDDGSTDDTLPILASFNDPRIRVLPGRKCGLADALNQGLLHARGMYIARMDADDLMDRERLACQTAYLDKHPETAVLGGWQQYFGLRSFCHKPSASAEQCQSNLLFRCDLCHSTLMLRKSVFWKNSLFYDVRFAAEDFELWTRVLDFGKIENIPKVLGHFRDNGQGITGKKLDRLIREHGEIVSASLKRNLQIELTEEQKKFFPGWISPFYDTRSEIPADKRAQAQEDLKMLFETILQRNRELGRYDESALQKAIAAEWASLRYREPYRISAKPIPTEELFRRRSRWELFWHRAEQFCSDYREPRQKIHKICSKIRSVASMRER